MQKPLFDSLKTACVRAGAVLSCMQYESGLYCTGELLMQFCPIGAKFAGDEHQRCSPMLWFGRLLMSTLRHWIVNVGVPCILLSFASSTC